MAEFQPLWIESRLDSDQGFEGLVPSSDYAGRDPIEDFEPLSADPDAFSAPGASTAAAAALGEGAEGAGLESAPLGDDEALRGVRDEYFEAGRQEGLDQGRAEIAGEVERILALGSRFDSLREEVFSRSVKDVADAVVHIARQVVRRELSIRSEGVEQLVLSALEHVRSSDELVIRLSPVDHEAFGDLAPMLFDRLGRDASFRIEVTPDLEPGGVVIQTEYGRIDASVEAQVKAFAESAEAWAREEVGVFDDDS